VELTNEGLRSQLTRPAFRDVLALAQQLAPAPPPRPEPRADAGADPGHVTSSSGGGGEAPQSPVLHLWDVVQEDVFRRQIPLGRPCRQFLLPPQAVVLSAAEAAPNYLFVLEGMGELLELRITPCLLPSSTVYAQPSVSPSSTPATPRRHASGAEEMEASVFVDGGWYDGNLDDGPPRDPAASTTRGSQRDRPPRRRSSSHHQQRKQQPGGSAPMADATTSSGKHPPQDVFFSSPDSEDFLESRESWHTAEWSDARRSSGSFGSTTASNSSPAGSSPTRYRADILTLTSSETSCSSNHPDRCSTRARLQICMS